MNSILVRLGLRLIVIMRTYSIYGLCLVTFIISCAPKVSSWNLGGVEISFPKLNSLNPYCYVKECCNEDWIRFRRGRLLRNLTDNVYGQPLLDIAVDALSAHFNPYYPPKKALTLSFHGMTGTGKNYVSDFIADSMYKNGRKSKYVHHFIGRMHFSEIKDADQYRLNLYSWLKGNISECGKQLFIFDEVDKMIPGILNTIKPMMDYRDNVDGVDYSQAVFIFLSNTGADIIREHYQDLYLKDGKNREDLKMPDFETYIQKGAFNEQGWFIKGDGYIISYARKILYSTTLGSFLHFFLTLGGFHHSDTILNNLIDHYIPFLPLEEKHVVKCIRKEFMLRRVSDPKQEHIEEVKKFIEWGPDKLQLFSKTGCKRLGPKVAVLVDKHYRHLTYDARDEL